MAPCVEGGAIGSSLPRFLKVPCQSSQYVLTDRILLVPHRFYNYACCTLVWMDRSKHRRHDRDVGDPGCVAR